MTTLKEPIDAETQAAADALAEATANFYIPPALQEAWDNLRFDRPVESEDILVSPVPRSEKRRRRTSMSMEDEVADVQHAGGGIGHVDAQMPSDESLGLPTPVEAACMHINERERLLAEAVASMSGVKVLRKAEGLRNALSAVLAMMHQRGIAERVLLIVPEAEVVAWKAAALEAQDEVAVSCYVKSAAATRDCLKSLKTTLPESERAGSGASQAHALKPRLVIAAKEYLHKKTRVLSKAPEKLLYKALEEGGSSRWGMVMFQCRDEDLVPSSAAFNLLEHRRLDSLLLFGAHSTLKKRKVVQLLTQSFPTMARDDLKLVVQSPRKVHMSEGRKSKDSLRRDDGRHILQPIEENISIPPRSGKIKKHLFSDEIPRPKRNSGSAVVDDKLISDSFRRRSRSKSGRKSSSSPRRGSAISRRGKIKEHVRVSLRESLAKRSSPCEVSTSPHVLMKRKARRKISVQPPRQFSIDSICENLASNRKKEQEAETIEIDSDFDPDCFVVAETKSQHTVVYSPIVSRSTSRVQRSLKPDNGRRPGLNSPTKRVSPAKTRSATFKKLVAASVADESATWNRPLGQIATLVERRIDKAARCSVQRNDLLSLTTAVGEGIASRHTPVISGPLARAAMKRTKTLPKFANGGPTYETAGRRRSLTKAPTYERSPPRRSSSMKREKLSTSEVSRRSSSTKGGKPSASEIPASHRSSKETPQRRISSTGKKEKPPMVQYASLGLMPANIRKKYNNVLRRAKDAEKCGDEEKALNLYLQCHDISDHDQILMTRILCFGGFAAGDFDFSKDGKRASLKNVSPKKSGGSSSRRQDAPKVQTQNQRKKNRTNNAAPCEVIVICD